MIASAVGVGGAMFATGARMESATLEEAAVEEAAALPPKGRLVAGVGVFVLGWVATLAMVGVIDASSLPSSVAAIVVFVGPKIGVLGAIAIMGKPGFTYLKKLVFGYLKPPAEVSPARHGIGTVMFVAALLLGLLERSGFRSYSVVVDLLLVASVFVLGGNFWDKMRALFIREAKVCLPARA